MELWMIYAVVGGTLSGVANFLSKSVAHHGINKHRVLLISKIVSLVISSAYILFTHGYVEVSIFLGLLIIAREIFATEKGLFIIESLKYIESSIFFPIHKVLNFIVALFVGMFIFGEYLGFIEYVVFVLAIFMILLLTGRENKKIQIDFKKGFSLLLLSNIALGFSSSINKYMGYISFDIPTYMFFSTIVGTFYMLGTKKDVYIKSKKVSGKKELLYGLTRGAFLYTGFVLLLLALREGEFVLVSIMYSSSYFIPIILSVIFYKEVINLRKILSFVLFLIIVVLLAYR